MCEFVWIDRDRDRNTLLMTDNAPSTAYKQSICFIDMNFGVYYLIIDGNKPVAVFAGSDCIAIPSTMHSCDIIESQLRHVPAQHWQTAVTLTKPTVGRQSVGLIGLQSADFVPDFSCLFF